MSRSKGIGGTDISAIVGMNPWKTPLDVWLDKTGQSPPDEDNENKWWGREMEPVLAKRYEKETGTKVYLPGQDGFYDNPVKLMDRPWYLGSPDGLINLSMCGKDFDGLTVINETEGGVDFKTSGKPQDWGEPGTDDIPQQYIIQAEWYMGLTGAQWWDVAVLLMGFARKFAIYRVQRDDELIGDLTEAGERFWVDHVLAGVAPALDGSKSATDYLKRKYPKDQGPVLESTDEFVLATLQEYRQVRDSLKKTEEYESHLQNTIKAIIGNNAGIKCPAGRATWTANKDSVKIDYEKVGLDMAEQLGLAMKNKDLALNIYADFKLSHSIIKPGARVFRVQFPKEVL